MHDEDWNGKSNHKNPLHAGAIVCRTIMLSESINIEQEKSRNKSTFNESEHIEDAIACITSTAEPMASFSFCTSACYKNKSLNQQLRIVKKFIMGGELQNN